MKKNKERSDVRGVLIGCVNYESCPMCYGCRNYRSEDYDCVECSKEDHKFNICNKDRHQADLVSRFITKNKIVLDKVTFKSNKN